MQNLVFFFFPQDLFISFEREREKGQKERKEFSQFGMCWPGGSGTSGTLVGMPGRLGSTGLWPYPPSQLTEGSRIPQIQAEGGNVVALCRGARF